MSSAMKIKIDASAYDFTPRGARRIRVVATDRGGRQMRWYVGGRIYRRMSVTLANVELSAAWAANAGAADNRPQPWENLTDR